MIVILATCRLVGLVAKRIGQPQVVGEMVAGVLLGPSLFGLLAPRVQAELFPPESLKVLFVVAQLGIGLYMFLVGVGFDTAMFRSRARSAAAVSLAGIVVPVVMGALLVPWFMRLPGMFGENVQPHEAALFLGAALAVTAFPMLARILEECGQAGTALGTLCLAAGALSDAAAWGMLTLAQASFGGDAALAVKVIGGGLACAVLILTLGRWLLARLGAAQADGRPSPPMVIGSLGLLLLGAWAAEAVGIHAVFGGFLLGLAVPRGGLTQALKRKLEPLTVALLLPIFFAYSGLNTRLDMVNSVELLGLALVVLAASCAGKFGACWAAARSTGEDNRTALAIGALMNARGLMELIILNIGLQLGIIQPPLFSMLVLMAVVTTLMATPVFRLVYGQVGKSANDE